MNWVFQNAFHVASDMQRMVMGDLLLRNSGSLSASLPRRSRRVMDRVMVVESEGGLL